MNEENVKIVFNGFVIDFFKTETGNLGMTVEREELRNDSIWRNSIDIYVDKKTLDVHGV